MKCVCGLFDTRVLTVLSYLHQGKVKNKEKDVISGESNRIFSFYQQEKLGQKHVIPSEAN